MRGSELDDSRLRRLLKRSDLLVLHAYQMKGSLVEGAEREALLQRVHDFHADLAAPRRGQSGAARRRDPSPTPVSTSQSCPHGPSPVSGSCRRAWKRLIRDPHAMQPEYCPATESGSGYMVEKSGGTTPEPVHNLWVARTSTFLTELALPAMFPGTATVRSRSCRCERASR